MGSPSDDDVPTMTSSADLRREGREGSGDDASGADAEGRTIQKPPDLASGSESAAIEAAAIDDGGDGDRTVTASGAKPPVDRAAPLSSTSPGLAPPRPMAVGPTLDSVPKDKLPPPPANPLRPRLPSSPSAAAPGGAVTPVRVRAPSSPAMKSTASASAGENAIDDPPTLESEPPPSEPRTSPKSPAASPLPVSARAPETPKMANAPPLPPRPSSPSRPSVASRPSGPASDTDSNDDSITATAPRVPAPLIALSPPKQVEIRTIEDDDAADETEVKTLAADVGSLVQAARADARAAASDAAKTKLASDATAASEAEEEDDSVTAQAPVVPGSPPDAAPAAKAPPRAGSAPVIRISGKSLMPSSQAEPYNADEEDSVTARGPALAPPYPIDGETEGTTKRVRAKAPSGHAAGEEQDSITTRAAGHLTNMLRVIASPSPSDPGSDDDDGVQAHTQVMANAPVKPFDYPSRRGPSAVAAPRLEPTSESGLRVANQDASGLAGDRASLGALGVAPHDARLSGGMRAPVGSDPAMMGASPDGAMARAPFPPMGMPPGDAEKKPPYALLVAIVAIVSIAIPIMLFFILRDSGGETAPRVLSQPTPDPVGVTGSRPRARPTTPPNRNGGATPAPRPGPIRR